MTDQTQAPDAVDAPPEVSLKDLEARARELNVEGRSKMNRDELVEAIAAAELANDPSQTPGTPDEVGRPSLAEVAAQSYLDRAPTKVIGEAPADSLYPTTSEA